TDREGYRQYKSNPEDCAVCPLREVYFSKKQKQKVITHHVWCFVQAAIPEKCRKNSRGVQLLF
ncbi:hypothetical protein, partial [Bacillus wiedmannii]|uniref:hypothetical protein n=1 Tax=Bacillus wiedmannii TaxID=1890302 RepID=UPI000BEC90FE